ncbi:SWIM zinc finger family protein [Actinocorallia sp. A-T 12471]|uniref:SWIM zinc finger family protein n=1 Tax=Actinocorallia sp. A-T 12471 TaxID=3089813 RepID=UPI0029CC40F4|nr:SWIM zinc finger family protein [Actinocorallia sp. A-T 12471]MDX6742786.1 SWIM zinc finger family protein [Actinocorallia sp. A-T 12471]
MTDSPLPPAAPGVVAEAVEALTTRLRKKLDAAVAQYAAFPVASDGDGVVRIVCGEDTTVTLRPGPTGVVADASQAECSCLLSPRCLHRAAVLSLCPVVEAVEAPASTPEVAESPKEEAAAAPVAEPPSARQVRAAHDLFRAAATILAAGVPAAGAVPQAELLRAAHTARVAGLHRAEAAALRVVRGLRSARARYDGHRLGDLVTALRELLLTSALLAEAHPDPALVGTARRAYRPGGSLRLQGVFREPVVSATGYGGVVTHLIGPDGAWYDLGDVRPGGVARARSAGTAAVELAGGVLDHARLARTGVLVTGATVSHDGRLGAGKGVRATEVQGDGWDTPGLFGRTLAECVAERLGGSDAADPEDAERRARTPLGCDLVILGPDGDHVLAREELPDGAPGTVVRLLPAQRSPELGHLENLRRIGDHPGLRLRVVARIEPGRASALVPLAVAPAPSGEATLTLPKEWEGHADLGYDRLQGRHFPAELPEPPFGAPPADPLADSPLWRIRRLVELAVSGGRRATAQSLRGDADPSRLRRTGFPGAATLAASLAEEADRRPRDAFGRLTDPDPAPFARAWLASAVHLHLAERTLTRTAWS